MKSYLNDYSAAPDESRMLSELSANLHRQKFTTTEEAHLFPEKTVIATRGACSLRVTDGTRSNQMAPILALQSQTVGALKFFYKGQWSSKPPILRSELERYVQLVLARLHIHVSRDVILAVASSPGCRRAPFDLSGARMEMMAKAVPERTGLFGDRRDKFTRGDGI